MVSHEVGSPAKKLTLAAERAASAHDGKDVPPSAIALLIDDDRVKQSVVIGEEVWTTP